MDSGFCNRVVSVPAGLAFVLGIVLLLPRKADSIPSFSQHPGTIPGFLQIGLRMNKFFQVVGRDRGNFGALSASTTIPQFIPRTDFEAGCFSILTAGNFGNDLAFWVDDDISVAGANGNGGLGDGYLKSVNIGRFLKLPKDSLTLVWNLFVKPNLLSPTIHREERNL
jgi:hypothetical protein